jgi:hypothetical protein
MRRGYAASVITSGWGEAGGLATVCTPRICSPLSHPSFSFLHSTVEASFDIKKACVKPHRYCPLKKEADLEYSAIFFSFLKTLVL